MQRLDSVAGSRGICQPKSTGLYRLSAGSRIFVATRKDSESQAVAQRPFGVSTNGSSPVTAQNSRAGPWGYVLPLDHV
jgi:hypothetical protein